MNIGKIEYKNTSRGVIHCHTDNSLKDCGIKVPDLVKRAVELQAPAITLTDHGTMMGIDEFMSSCKNMNIKGIPGVEVYYQNENDRSRRHLILLAKDYTGYVMLAKIVSKSNERLDSKGYPRVNKEILSDVLAKYGKDHLIATSACVGGILASTLLESKNIEKEIAKLEDKIKNIPSPHSEVYKKNVQLLNDIEKKIVEMMERKKELQKISKTPFKKKENAVESAKKAGDMELYHARLEALKKEKEEVKNAEKELKNVTSQITSLTKRKKEIKEQISNHEKEHDKWELLNNKIEELKTEIVSPEISYKKAKEDAIWFKEIFGEGNFYIELQYHGIDIEMESMKILVKMARELNIPMIAANDVHILKNEEEDLLQRQLMRSLRFNKWEPRQIGDDQLYMKTDEELASSLYKIVDEDAVAEAMNNITVLIDSCNVEFPNEGHYPLFISDKEGETAEEAIERLAREAIPKFFAEGKWTQVYEDRLKYELGVINGMGYANYHLIVQDFLNFGRKLGKLSKTKLHYLENNAKNMTFKEFNKYVEENTNEVALSIGPGRGSAAGSLVCYLLGITSIDPIKFDLLFERKKIALLKSR